MAALAAAPRASIGHVAPEAAAGGAIGLVQNGDLIRIDIPNRSINVLLSDEVLAARRVEQNTRVGNLPSRARAKSPRRCELMPYWPPVPIKARCGI